jgi:hypothetical protein
MQNDPCVLYDYIWSKDVLDHYREMCTDKNWRGQQVHGNGKLGNRQTYDISKDYPNPDTLVTAYRNYLSSSVSNQLRILFRDGYSVDCKLSRYAKHQEYNWHCDTSVQISIGNPQWERIISSITYLNDDYEGGHTEFEKFVITPEAGKTVIFPSAFTYPHRGTPVIKGLKHILVMHFWA